LIINKRPKASELLKHPYFTDYHISKDIYNHAKGKLVKKIEKNDKHAIESLKISPSGITIENNEDDR
jgi:hypothetical protein